MRKDLRPDSLKQQKITPSHSRLEVQTQGVGRLVPSEAVKANLVQPLSFPDVADTVDGPWLVEASPHFCLHVPVVSL